jgi:hypothetical protein
MSDLYVNKYIWDKKLINNLYKSCSELFNMSNLQVYNPLYSLYFHIYNTKNSHRYIDLKRRYYIHKLSDFTKFKYYHSNCLLNGTVYDSKENKLLNLEVFSIRWKEYWRITPARRARAGVRKISMDPY